MKKQKRRGFLKAGAGAALVSGLARFSPTAHAAETKRPNIIFLMDDQHRWDALGVVNPMVKTPNLDKLARAGVFYREAVCQAPMCTPSRNSTTGTISGRRDEG